MEKIIKTNKRNIIISNNYENRQRVAFYSPERYNEKAKPRKNEEQKKIYKNVRDNGLGSDIFSITGSGIKYHLEGTENDPGLLQIKSPDSKLVIAEICPRSFDIMLRYVQNLGRNDILLGCGDFYDVITAFYQSGHLTRQLTFLDLDFCATPKTLIKETLLLDKFRDLLVNQLVANNFALTITYSLRGSSIGFNDELFFKIQQIAKDYKFRIPSKNHYFEAPYCDLNDKGNVRSHMRTIFGTFVKDRYTQQFPGYFRHGDSFIL